LGCGYVKIAGWTGDLNLDAFTGCLIYSKMDLTGAIETSNAKVKQLIKSALWSQKGNFRDIPTDRPQRDERLGWTGDIQVFSGTAREAIGVFPTGLNVAVAASLATVGPEKLQVTMESTPRFAAGDRQRVEIQNDQVHAVVDVFSATSEIAGWSVVATLQNIVSPIVF